MSSIIEFIVCVLGCTTIGSLWFGNIGLILGFLLGIYLFRLLQKRKKNNIDYGKIEKMIKENTR